ncbi:MAG: tRNA-dihydrouridine synthase family protein [Lachnospiraceae bacterium]|nr:tRNA-dihydrouridine synthase family protein [Candidatus Colinaster scatohippi]
MELYQAPLEGISGYIYRKAIHKYFGGIDKYFAPFISPYEKRIITDRERNQLCPEHNEGYLLVPQILTMDANGFLELTGWLNEHYGYEEFNLNFGCPSGTVVSKGRGAGALGNLMKLDEFLDRIFSVSPYRISIKTRLGLHNPEEFDEILDIYNKYPISELIIHPRVRAELYKGVPHYDIYKAANEKSNSLTVYNGNITSLDSLHNIEGVLDSTNAVMIGRGMLSNPSLFREIKGGASANADELCSFIDEIRDDYMRDFSGEIPVLHKMKEIWSYMGPYLVDKYNIDERLSKKIIKAKHLSEYNICKNELFRAVK